MIGYMCKYAPIELMAGFGIDTELMVPNEESLDVADSNIYPSMCTYAKATMQHAFKTSYEAILFTDCCDAMKRVSDVLARQPHQSVHSISLPRLADHQGIAMYARILERFVNQLEGALGKTFDVDEFLNACISPLAEESNEDYVAILGARVPPSLLLECKRLSRLPIRDLTCASQKRCFGNPPVERDRPTLMTWYASNLLQQTPCLRMANTAARDTLLADSAIKGVIYHTIKFCDFYSFEYAAIKRTVPMLKLETDFTPASAGQLKTRLEAFFETLGLQESIPKQQPNKGATGKHYIGIDIGSTSTDAVVLDREGQLVAKAVVPTGAKSVDAANSALEQVLAQAGLRRSDIENMITTGYGRKAVDFRSNDITEISCHAKGVNHLFPQARGIIDIGGQDSKVIRLNEDGAVADFAMNDKCAAGTGRFLELIASTLSLSLEQMSAYGLRWHEEVTISSMCAVFAESEVISLIAQNKETCDIVHGINVSIAGRIAGLVARVHATGPFVMSGGVAENRGMLLALEQKLCQPILVPEYPQLCGALGAALFAMD